jgi:hypothetical protein
VTSTDRSAEDLAQLDGLLHALERANESVGEEALAEGLKALGACYASLSPATSPEACAHLEAAYDACLRGLGDAYGGNRETLLGAVAIVRAIRDALVPADKRVRRAA